MSNLRSINALTGQEIYRINLKKHTNENWGYYGGSFTCFGLFVWRLKVEEVRPSKTVTTTSKTTECHNPKKIIDIHTK